MWSLLFLSKGIMKLQHERPIMVFDLETTGTSITKDRIVELSIIKIYPNGDEEVKTRRINPEMPIPAEATAVHGISDEDVKDCPTFKQVAQSLYDWIKGCDIIGFNSNRFDVPFLVEELLRAGVNDLDFHERALIDVQAIFHKMEPRTLSAGYRYYCNKTLENAHSAEADTRATWEILQAQLERYKDEIPADVEGLSAFSQYHKYVDFAGTLIYDEQGNEVINIGKYKGQLLQDVLRRDPGYYAWIMKADFSLDTKQCFSQAYRAITNEQK